MSKILTRLLAASALTLSAAFLIAPQAIAQSGKAVESGANVKGGPAATQDPYAPTGSAKAGADVTRAPYDPCVRTNPVVGEGGTRPATKPEGAGDAPADRADTRNDGGRMDKSGPAKGDPRPAGLQPGSSTVIAGNIACPADKAQDDAAQLPDAAKAPGESGNVTGQPKTKDNQ